MFSTKFHVPSLDHTFTSTTKITSLQSSKNENIPLKEFIFWKKIYLRSPEHVFGQPKAEQSSTFWSSNSVRIYCVFWEKVVFLQQNFLACGLTLKMKIVKCNSPMNMWDLHLDIIFIKFWVWKNCLCLSAFHKILEIPLKSPFWGTVLKKQLFWAEIVSGLKSGRK